MISTACGPSSRRTHQEENGLSLAIVTGSSGLIGSEMSRFLCAKGWDVVGVDNDMRAYFFGQEASTKWKPVLG